MKEAFDLYANGFTVKQICDKSMRQVIRPKGAHRLIVIVSKQCSPTGKYIGIYTYNNEVEIEGGVPAIVDKETFDLVQGN